MLMLLSTPKRILLIRSLLSSPDSVTLLPKTRKSTRGGLPTWRKNLISQVTYKVSCQRPALMCHSGISHLRREGSH